MLPVPVAVVMLSGYFHYSPGVPKGHLLLRQEAPAVLAPPIPVVLVLYKLGGR